MSSDQVTVFIVDDDPKMRESLSFLLDSVGIPTQTFPGADAFLDVYDPAQPGCAIVDERMPGMSGRDLHAKLIKDGIGIPVVLITGYAEVEMAVESMKMGAVDVLRKPFSDNQLLEAVKRALKRDRETRRTATERSNYQVRRFSLTPREREVMDMVAAGKPNKVMGMELGISERTVELHRAHMMEKMEVSSVADLIRLAARFDK
ncbi:MAG: response regulator transcription factor [Candidatus Binatia bacterium]